MSEVPLYEGKIWMNSSDFPLPYPSEPDMSLRHCLPYGLWTLQFQKKCLCSPLVGAYRALALAKSYVKRELNQKLSGNEVHYTNCFILPVNNMLCGNFLKF
jgi:hypothetical protein